MGRFLPLLVFLGANACAQVLLYLVHLERLNAQLLMPPSAGLNWAFMGYTTAALLGLMCVFLGLARLEFWLRRRSPSEVSLVGRSQFVLQPLLLLCMLADIRTYETLGVHLYSPSVLDALLNPGAGRELQLGAATGISLALVALLLAAVEWGGYRLSIWLCRGRERSRWLIGVVAVFFVGSLSVAWATHPERPTGADRFILDAVPGHLLWFGASGFEPEEVGVDYPGAVPTEVTLNHRPNIVFVQVESLRADVATAEYMPFLHERITSGECLASERHYSGAHTTEYGTFALLYGLHSYHFDPFAHRSTASYPLEVLRNNGYELVAASASALQDWNDAGFLVDQFDEYHEYLEESEGLGDQQVVAWARKFVEERDSSRPFLMFLFLNATHHNYRYPPSHERYTPVLEEDYDHFMGDDTLYRFKDQVRNRYFNAVGYVDSLLKELADTLARTDPVWVWTGDHGEEFWEHGLLGHAAPRFIEERIRVPLVMCLPGHPPARVLSSQHIDVFPTLFDYLDARVPAQSYSQGVSLLAGSVPRTLFVGGLDFPYRSRNACLMDASHKHWVELCSRRSLCLLSVRTTTLDDQMVDARGDGHALRPLLPDMYLEMQRFLRFPTQ